MTQLSPRDMTVLTILAEMYGAPLDLVQQMLGISRRRTYYVTNKWAEARMVSDLKIRPVPGAAWIYPTRTAAESLTGRWARAWVPTPKMAAHTRAVLEVRLALVGLDLDRWVSERAMRSEQPPTRAGVARTHVHDGRWITSTGELRAVEVELSPKNLTAAKSAMAQAVQAASTAECERVTYYCRGEAVKNVIRSAAAGLNLADGPKVHLADLDELLAPVSDDAPRPGLRVIEGGASDHEIPQVTDPNEDTDTDGEAVGS
jgi:hypothetical protein